MGLVLGGKGYDFSGDFTIKGCYAYNGGKYVGRIYYGNGGTDQEVKASLVAPTYRPYGYDCKSKFTLLYEGYNGVQIG